MHHPPHLQAVWTEICVTHCFCDWSTFWFKHPLWMWDIWRTAVLSHICVCHHIPEADLHFDSRVFLQLLKPHSELFPHRGVGLKKKKILMHCCKYEQSKPCRTEACRKAGQSWKLNFMIRNSLRGHSQRHSCVFWKVAEKTLKLHSGTRLFDSCNWVTWCGLWCWGKLVQH